ncbi:hypothetical protein CWO91_00980 [Bradyrhizobium genosp. SA-3]|uniref:DUF3592 domain-containing protein n=1 Tax=Bradyrhizobium genosp. SA-3 TaxID=508868 RepID=UPI00102A0211|nr:DUF3592 domain-containing protein [Bradyrhizobium genosp. SA-3]RZN13183.1 hypothetical protein CWO91_00980 [Bradyrhizobium genosp. SA-3]
MQQRSVLPGRLGKYCFIPIGLLLLLATACTAWTTKVWLTRAVEVRGQVIEMVRVRAKERQGYLFTPLVRFQTADGRLVEFQSSHRSNPPAYYTGQAVSVLYDPEQPSSAAIRGVLSIWSLPMVLSFLGTIFLALGAAITVLTKRELAQPDVDAKFVGG